MSAPKKSSVNKNVFASPITNSIPRGAERVTRRSMFWGKQVSETKNLCVFRFTASRLLFPNSIAIASAAAVASSNKEALAIGMAVKSITIVWKFNRASKRP